MVNLNEPSILVMKGNFTQRQFDALGTIWNDLQKSRGVKSLPALQLSGSEGNLGIMTVHQDGSVSTCSVFENKVDASDVSTLIKAMCDQLDDKGKLEIKNYINNS